MYNQQDFILVIDIDCLLLMLIITPSNWTWLIKVYVKNNCHNFDNKDSMATSSYEQFAIYFNFLFILVGKNHVYLLYDSQVEYRAEAPIDIYWP